MVSGVENALDSKDFCYNDGHSPGLPSAAPRLPGGDKKSVPWSLTTDLEVEP